MHKLTLEEQGKEILRMAEETGLQTNYFFATTFERYETQLQILKELKKSIDEDGALVTKEYVKGRGNLYASPAISEYNRTTDSANKTVSTLIRIIKSFESESKTETDPLLDVING